MLAVFSDFLDVIELLGILLFGSYHLREAYMDPSNNLHNALHYSLCSSRRMLISYILRCGPCIHYVQQGGSLLIIGHEADARLLCSTRQIRICSTRRTLTSYTPRRCLFPMLVRQLLFITLRGGSFLSCSTRQIPVY